MTIKCIRLLTSDAKLTLDEESYPRLYELVQSGLVVFDFQFHSGSQKIIPNVKVAATGSAISILPLIGVKANSKSRTDIVFDYRRSAFNPQRYITPMSINEWIRWANKEVQAEWETNKRFNSRVKHNLVYSPSRNKSNTTHKQIEPNVITVTPVEILMQAGLTRAEAVEHIVKHFIKKQ